MPYPYCSSKEWGRMCKQVLCGLFHSAGVEQGFHGMFSWETHIHQLKAHKSVFFYKSANKGRHKQKINVETGCIKFRSQSDKWGTAEDICFFKFIYFVLYQGQGNKFLLAFYKWEVFIYIPQALKILNGTLTQCPLVRKKKKRKKNHTKIWSKVLCHCSFKRSLGSVFKCFLPLSYI